MTKYFNLSDFDDNLLFVDEEYYCFKCKHSGAIKLSPVSNVANYHLCPKCKNESYANVNLMKLNGLQV